MFKEQYRRDNERLHAREELLMEIKKKANAPSRGAGRTGFARYGALAAAMLLVLTGVAGVLLNPAAKGGDGTEPRMTVSAAAAPQEAANAGEATAEVLRLENYEDLYALMMETRREVYADGAVAGGGFKSEAAAEAEAPAADEPAASSSAAMDRGESAAPRPGPVPTGAPAGGEDGAEYSGTNTQVRGVDEADIVKTDGQ